MTPLIEPVNYQHQTLPDTRLREYHLAELDMWNDMVSYSDALTHLRRGANISESRITAMMMEGWDLLELKILDAPG